MLALPRVIREVFRDRSASAVVVTAFSILSLVGAAGLATDTIQWTLWKRQLQRMSDSAALAGAFTKARGGNASAAATTELDRYNIITISGTPSIVEPTTGTYANRSVTVTLNAQRILPFSGIFMSAAPTIRATATAAAVGFGTYCVIALESTTANGITFQGSCGAMTNSQGSGTNSSTAAVYAGGSSSVTASPISAMGVVQPSSNYATGTTLTSYAIPQADPFAAVALPSGYSCSGQLSVGSNQNRNVQNNSGGVQCYRGMDLKGTVTFDPGTYVIDGSTGNGLNVGAQAVVNCSGCTFILTTSSTDYTTVATSTMNGGAIWNVTAPDSGTYAGIMLYQDRNAVSTGSNSVSGNSTTTMRGAYYFPAQSLTFIGNGSVNTQCVQIVARVITFTGNSTITNVCPSSSASKAIAGTQIRLVD